MAARTCDPTVLFCGFRRFDEIAEYFKEKSLKLGEKLYAGRHVFGVKEEVLHSTAPSEVVGKCLAQIKPAVYNVQLQLSAHPRLIVGASFTCKAGVRGWCKHGAALATFVNSEKHTACTDRPCAWGKPSSRPVLDKKKRIDELFPRYKSQLGNPVVRPASTSLLLLGHFGEIRCPLAEVLQAENKDDVDRDFFTLLSEMVNVVVDQCDTEMLTDLLKGEKKVYGVMEIVNPFPLRIQKHDPLLDMTQESRALYETFVCKNFDEILEIALMTRGQAAASRWAQERKFRLTSTKAHGVKTRRAKFHRLANSLAHPKTFTSAATSYGRATKGKARAVLARALGKPVHQVGLVIHPDQQWLSCSPDGILCCDDGYRLLEVKCPYSLRDSKLIDYHKETSFVKYVKYVDEHLVLKKSHSYYTQKQHIIVTVPRDEQFLAEYVPKLENFYFRYMLKAFQRSI